MPDMEETFTKEAPDFRCGITPRVTLNTPFRFTLTSLSQYSSVVSSSGMDVGFTPAQLKTWSILPNFWSVSSMKFWTSLTEETSTSERWGGVGVPVQSFEVASRLS